MKKTPLPVSRLVLYHLYVEQGMSVADIAALFGEKTSTIKRMLNGSLIKQRSPGRQPNSYLSRAACQRIGMWAVLGRAYASKLNHNGQLYHQPTVEGLMKALETMTLNERTALALHYGLTGRKPMTFMAIGRYLGISDGRAEALVNSAIRKLRSKRRYRHIYSKGGEKK
ncbi:MAG TPA: sigma factor-like helix-turn-helix DNA-binding protein [bacterium]|nr:sigma factor-like helix-turn-helix DNA-binding protein [bacterium]